MSKGLSEYAVWETGFKRDARVLQLTPAHRWAYLCLWTWAVEDRRECLKVGAIAPKKGQGSGPHCSKSAASLQQVCSNFAAQMPGIDRRTALRALQECHRVGLIKLTQFEGSSVVIVCGVRAKHRAMRRWHDDDDAAIKGQSHPPVRGDRPPAQGAIEGDMKEKEKENEQRSSSSSVSGSLKRRKRVAPIKGDDDDKGAIAPKSTGAESGGSKQDEYIAVFDAWTNALGRLCTSRDYERLSDMMATYSPKAVAQAIAIAHEHNARSLAYVQRVLDNGTQEATDLSKFPNAYRNRRGVIVRDSQGKPMTPRKGLQPKWNDDHSDIVGWNRVE